MVEKTSYSSEVNATSTTATITGHSVTYGATFDFAKIEGNLKSTIEQTFSDASGHITAESTTNTAELASVIQINFETTAKYSELSTTQPEKPSVIALSNFSLKFNKRA